MRKAIKNFLALAKLLRRKSIILLIKEKARLLTVFHTHAAGIFSYAILHPEAVMMENGKMTDEFRVDGKFKPVEYDFESGDLKDYIELVKIGFWD